MELLSIVVPCYNEEAGLARFYAETSAVCTRLDAEVEFIFVDDGSRDGTLAALKELAAKDKRVRWLALSRNFGKEAAIFAGLEAAKGDCCAVIDCDLQHPPEKLPEMYALWQEGWEVVNGVKSDRGKESGLHTFAANTFYRMMSKAVRIDMARASDFKLMDRRVVDALLGLGERKTFFRALAGWGWSP